MIESTSREKAGLAVIARAALVLICALTPVAAQDPPDVPTWRVTTASRLSLPGAIDSSNPMVWDLVEGEPRLFVFSSWGGLPTRSEGPSLEGLVQQNPPTFDPHPGHGVWMESIVPDEGGTWYGYYHHERPAETCGRLDRQLPRIGAVKSSDRGQTWQDLGIVLDAPPGSEACGSSNRFVLGGVGDVTAALDADKQFLYLYFSQYSGDPRSQGVAVARLSWAERDEPVGKITVWNEGVWLPATKAGSDDPEAPISWEYPSGSVLVRATQPFHDHRSEADVFWGASIHWNTYLEQYVMLVNRARDELFNQEGAYVSFSPTLDDPLRWTAPQKILNRGGWYAQVGGLEPGSGTDRLAGKRARLFITGKSDHVIEFER